MANKNTLRLRRRNLSSKVAKGVAVPKDGLSAVGTSLSYHEYPSTKGNTVDSHKGRENRLTPGGKPRKAWKGCGDPLGRNKN